MVRARIEGSAGWAAKDKATSPRLAESATTEPAHGSELIAERQVEPGGYEARCWLHVCRFRPRATQRALVGAR